MCKMKGKEGVENACKTNIVHYDDGILYCLCGRIDSCSSDVKCERNGECCAMNCENYADDDGGGDYANVTQEKVTLAVIDSNFVDVLGLFSVAYPDPYSFVCY